MPGLNFPLLDEYFEAFRAREIGRCVDLYAEGAVVEFGTSYYRDRKALEKFHRERFAANLTFLEIDQAVVEGEVVTIDGVIVSDRLKTWRIGSLPARARFTIRNGKIAEARFGLANGAALKPASALAAR